MNIEINENFLQAILFNVNPKVKISSIEPSYFTAHMESQAGLYTFLPSVNNVIYFGEFVQTTKAINNNPSDGAIVSHLFDYLNSANLSETKTHDFTLVVSPDMKMIEPPETFLASPTVIAHQTKYSGFAKSVKHTIVKYTDGGDFDGVSILASLQFYGYKIVFNNRE